MNRILFIIIFSGLSYLVGKAVYKTIRFESKIFGIITALLSLSISVFLMSLASGASALVLLSENSLMVFFIPILASSYYGYMNNVESEMQNKKEVDSLTKPSIINKEDENSYSKTSPNYKVVNSGETEINIDIELLNESYEELNYRINEINDYPTELLNEFLIIYYEFRHLGKTMSKQGAMGVFNEAFLKSGDILSSLDETTNKTQIIDFKDNVNNLIPLLEELRTEEPQNFRSACNRAISTFKNRPTVVRQDLIKKINNKESDELSPAKTDKKVDNSKNTSNKKGIDSNKTKKEDVKPDKSLLTILEMGEVPIEDTIFEVSVSLSDSIEEKFDEINASNRIFVLWEVSMFFSVLAYSCQQDLTDNDYKEMHNTFGVMAREIGTQPNMSKETQEKMFSRYFESVTLRVEDYDGGTNELFCEKLFQNISKVAEINSTDFIESGPSFIKTNTFHFTSGVKRLNGQYSHIS